VVKEPGMEKDPVLEFVRVAAAREKEVLAIRLFGSRARGDHHARSDYDLAVEAPKWTPSDWARFSEGLRESVPSLAGLDLVRYGVETSPSLREAIERDGRIIFRREGN
jgi:predicted nucleotidyltransferase